MNNLGFATNPNGRYRSVSSPLRPVYAEYFPRFNESELRARLMRLDTSLATLLSTYNLSEARRLQLIPQNFEARRPDLIRVLARTDFDARVVDAFRKVDRGEFVEAIDPSQLYLNATLQTLGHSFLSAPGLVLYMVDRIVRNLKSVTGRIVEIGSGSGFHLAIIGEVLPKFALCGYETEQQLASQSTNWLTSRFGNRAAVFNKAVEASTVFPAPVDVVYQTATRRDGVIHEIAAQLSIGGIYQCVRALTEREFAMHGPSTWLRYNFRDYDEYFNGSWNLASCIETFLKDADGQLSSRDRLYGVQFVEFQER